MKIALLGYGKMGQAIEKIATELNVEVVPVLLLMLNGKL